MKLRCCFASLAMMLAVVGCAIQHAPQPTPIAIRLSNFQPTEEFDEQIRETVLPDGVRIHFNAPGKLNPALPNRIVLYALPNGNSIEQTLGALKTDALDWRFDIQHIAAQNRVLRKVTPDENIFLVLVEADTKAWPAWRAKRPENARLIADIFAGVVSDISNAMPGSSPQTSVTLMAHSGGGSFIWGLMNHAEIPPIIDRIAFLDANYSFDSNLQHGEKFLRWLQQDLRRQLVVVAYDDREILFEGKRVIGPTGGTWRASGRMTDDFRQHISLTTSRDEHFDIITGLPRADGGASQLAFYLHRNPQNLILHTRLVGEMNGFLMAAILGTPVARSWGSFGGPRAYSAFVQAKPFVFSLKPPVTAP